MDANRQRGDGKIGLIIFLLILAGVIFFCVKYIPPKISVSEMETFTEELALGWAMRPDYYRYSPEMIKKEILDKAQNIHLPLTEKSITATKSGQNAAISLKYEVPIDFVVYTYVIKVDKTFHGGL